MALGIIAGLILSPTTTDIVDDMTATMIGEWIALPGVIFLGLLKMVVIPLVITSIVLGVIDSGSLNFLKTMGAKIIPYFLLTSFISISIGVFVVQAINPAQYINTDFVNEVMVSSDVPYAIFDQLTVPQRIENMLPVNFTEASLEKNMLQIVIFSILLGIIMLGLPKSKTKTSQSFANLGKPPP